MVMEVVRALEIGKLIMMETVLHANQDLPCQIAKPAHV